MKGTSSSELTGPNKLLALAGKGMSSISFWFTGSFRLREALLNPEVIGETPKQKVDGEVLSKTLSTEERLRLPRLLNSFPLAQFEELVFALNPPAGILSPNNAPQGTRTIELLTWLESSTGPGFEKLYTVMRQFDINEIASSKAEVSARLSFAIAGNINKVDYAKLKAIVAVLQDMADDTSIAIHDIEEGSIKLTLVGSQEALAKLKKLFDENKLINVDGTEVLDVAFLPKQTEDVQEANSIDSPQPDEQLVEQTFEPHRKHSQNLVTSRLPKLIVLADGTVGYTSNPTDNSSYCFPDHPSIHSPLKRSVDIIVALLGLLFLAIIVLPLAIIIKLDSPGSVFYTQTRYGLHGRPFTLWKFRTMVQNADELKNTVSNQAAALIFRNEVDPRITQFGRLLQRNGLDNIPQLWNVLKGEMSLVGPRPPEMDEVTNYDSYQWQKLVVKPGITGVRRWHQDDSEQDLDVIQGLITEFQYQNTWSLMRDLEILWKSSFGRIELLYIIGLAFLISLGFVVMWRFFLPTSPV